MKCNSREILRVAKEIGDNPNKRLRRDSLFEICGI
jgi:hypothetical protein